MGTQTLRRPVSLLCRWTARFRSTVSTSIDPTSCRCRRSARRWYWHGSSCRRSTVDCSSTFPSSATCSAAIPAEVLTPGLLWQLRPTDSRSRPITSSTSILNPWGFGSYQLGMRLPEGAVLELIARRIGEVVASPGKQINLIGGRLVGRYWYNVAYGAQQ